MLKILLVIIVLTVIFKRACASCTDYLEKSTFSIHLGPDAEALNHNALLKLIQETTYGTYQGFECTARIA